MAKWIKISPEWHLRPKVGGFELFTKERSLVIERTTEELEAYLSGRKPVLSEDETAFAPLVAEGAVSFTHQMPEPQPLSRVTDKVWRLRRRFIGEKAPVSGVYWLDPSLSKFQPARSTIFHAKHSMLTEKGNNQYVWAAGVDSRLELAELKAIVEALERYGSGIVSVDCLIPASHQQLGDAALDPRQVVAYTPYQYRNGLPLHAFDKEAEYYWKRVVLYPSGEERYLPVECLYYPVPPSVTPQIYTFANSSGVAAGFDYEETLKRALREAIERDAFMVTWLNRLRLPRIKLSTLPRSLRELICPVEALGYQVHLIDLTLDISPTILAVAVSEKLKPALVLGMASGHSPEELVRKAISELEHQLYWDFREGEIVRELKEESEVWTTSDHAALFSHARHLDKAAFLWQGPPEAFGDCLHAKISVSCSTDGILEPELKEVVVADLTPCEFHEVGLSVLRVIPLGLTPMSFGYGLEPLGMPRIQEVPQKLGIEVDPWPAGVPFTHPFA